MGLWGHHLTRRQTRKIKQGTKELKRQTEIMREVHPRTRLVTLTKEEAERKKQMSPEEWSAFYAEKVAKQGWFERWTSTLDHPDGSIRRPVEVFPCDRSRWGFWSE